MANPKAHQKSESATIFLSKIGKRHQWYYGRYFKRWEYSGYFISRDKAIKVAFENGFGIVIDETGKRIIKQ